MIRAIHIDDEEQSREMLRIAATGLEELELVAGFSSGRAAIAWLQENKAQVAFVDVEMPEQNGIELALELAAFDIDIIFLTAHAQFALRAFEACAMDYIVKPIYGEKLQLCLSRYLQRMKKHSSAPAPQQKALSAQVTELLKNFNHQPDYPQRLFVSQVGEVKIINLDQVMYFEASRSYTKIWLKGGSPVMSSEPIKCYADMLEAHPQFARIHRSYLVNKSHISSIQRKDRNIFVKMHNDEVLPIAQYRKDEIFEILKH